MPQKAHEEKTKNQTSKYLMLTTLGIQLAVGMAFFTFLGYFIDQKRGNGQAFTLMGIFLGLLYCGYEIWKVIKYLSREENKNK